MQERCVHHDCRERSRLVRRLVLLLVVGSLALVLASGVALAASRVQASGLHCDASGNDNYSSNLNGEYVVFKNSANRGIRMGGWKVHYKGRIHTYRFPSGFKLGAGKTVTLHSGKGNNGNGHLYWGRSNGAVWNNDGDTATLRDRSGGFLDSRSC